MKFYKTIFFVLISFILIGCQSKSNEDLVNRTIIEPETKQEKQSETKKVKIKDYPRDTTPGVFYVKKGKNKSYLDTYTLGIEEDVIDQWIRENQIDKKKS